MKKENQKEDKGIKKCLKKFLSRHPFARPDPIVESREPKEEDDKRKRYHKKNNK